MKTKLTIIFTFFLIISVSAQKRKVWIDADTGNEMDDLYAITYLLLDSTVDVLGVSSAHFNNPDLLSYNVWNSYPTKNINSVKISQQLNEKLLKYLHRLNIPHPLGSDKMIGRAWGGQEPSPSAASAMIIEKANQMNSGEKLDVLVIGASSNISSALLTDTTILSKIRVFLLGARYFEDRKVWDKSEFNIRNDLNSFDYLLNLQGLDLTIMPVNVAIALQFQRKTSKEKLEKKNEFYNFLYSRWDLVSAGESWIMWDLALVEAYLHTELANLITAKTPLENNQRNISVYNDIDNQKMEELFWKRLKGWE